MLGWEPTVTRQAAREAFQHRGGEQDMLVKGHNNNLGLLHLQKMLNSYASSKQLIIQKAGRQSIGLSAESFCSLITNSYVCSYM